LYSFALWLLLSLRLLAVVYYGRKKHPLPTPEQPPEQQIPMNEIEDGTYTGETEPDDEGWRGVVEIVVDGGEIKRVMYEEYDEGDNPKSASVDYNAMWKADAGINAEEAFPQYEEDLIEKQNIEEVDVITGATKTHEKFTQAVKNALEEESN
jgi:major membrane immunogen (membrane-anchored lipoprotein)